MPLDILFEDNHLFVVNKPAGLLTQPSGTSQDSLENHCKDWIKEAYQKPGNVFLAAAHRLDKPASGIVIFAKTSKALSRLNESIRDKRFKKSYYALVEGSLKESEGVLEHYLMHDDYQARLAKADEPNAKFCRLLYNVVDSLNSFTLLDIDLETGRYHQIRAQLAAMGYPIIGDHKYGSRVKFMPEAIALHHYYLEIPHPTTKILMQFKAPIPEQWKKLKSPVV